MEHLSNRVRIWSIQDLQRHYEEKAQGHWFKPDTLRFFKSRINENLFYTADVILFISSEQRQTTEPRRYSIRQYSPFTGEIHTVGLGFQGYKTLAAAKLAAGKIAKLRNATLFREYFNNYLTVEKFANDHSLPYETAQGILIQGRIDHERQAAQK